MFVENLNLDNHCTPYKIVISKEPNDLDLLKSMMARKYNYRFTVYFANSKVYSRGYIKNIDKCREQAKQWFDKNIGN